MERARNARDRLGPYAQKLIADGSSLVIVDCGRYALFLYKEGASYHVDTWNNIKVTWNHEAEDDRHVEQLVGLLRAHHEGKEATVPTGPDTRNRDADDMRMWWIADHYADLGQYMTSEIDKVVDRLWNEDPEMARSCDDADYGLDPAKRHATTASRLRGWAQWMIENPVVEVHRKLGELVDRLRAIPGVAALDAVIHQDTCLCPESEQLENHDDMCVCLESEKRNASLDHTRAS